MTDLLELTKKIVDHRAAYVGVGSFMLYVLGYLALRSHLAALGIDPDIELAILDMRHLFAGANFLIYLCTTVPSLIMLVLVLMLVLVPGVILYGVYRILPAGVRAVLGSWLGRYVTWAAQPARLLPGGIVFSLLMIQFVMRDCFELNNLLLRSDFPDVAILGNWLLREDESRIALFFLGMVAGCAISGLILLALRRRPPTGDFLVFAHYLLLLLVALQVLLLPINYGYLVHKSLPRVVFVDESAPLGPEMDAWLVWAGQEGITYLVRNRQTNPATKVLVTLRRDQVKRIEITGYDHIFSTLFASRTGTKP